MTLAASAPPAAPRNRRRSHPHVYWLLVVSALFAVIAFLLTKRAIPVHPPIAIDSAPPYTRTQVALKGGEYTLQSVFDDLAKQSNVRIRPLWSAPDHGFRPEARISLPSQACTVAAAMSAVAAQFSTRVQVDYEADGIVLGLSDQLLVPARASVVVYPIRDLLSVDAWAFSIPTREARIEELTRLIEHVVQPDAWRENGGIVGTITPINDRFVISATPAMHYQIERLLDGIRQR